MKIALSDQPSVSVSKDGWNIQIPIHRNRRDRWIATASTLCDVNVTFDEDQFINSVMSERAMNRTTTSPPVCSRAIYCPFITEIFPETSLTSQ